MKHGNLGNNNAVKIKGASYDHLNIRCNVYDKIEWEKKAREDGFSSLSAWVVATLNGEAKK